LLANVYCKKESFFMHEYKKCLLQKIAKMTLNILALSTFFNIEYFIYATKYKIALKYS
jgi:hypothetical protein